MKKAERAGRIVELLKQEYPDAACSLNYKTPIQLVVATMLSAQSTDVRVNLVTPALFRKYRSIKAFAEDDLTELEGMIRSVGLYHTKAKNIIAMAASVRERFRSRFPDTVTQLQSLPGIGRKSANVIQGELSDNPEGIAVDTHVTRLSFRLGLTLRKDPKRIELDLLQVIAPQDRALVSHLLIFHGRAVCDARKPACSICKLRDTCPRKGVKNPS